jgi:hypothetical protein
LTRGTLYETKKILDEFMDSVAKTKMIIEFINNGILDIGPRV